MNQPENSPATPAWQREFAQAVTDPHDLLARLGLAQSGLIERIDPHPQFKLKVPLSFVDRMQQGNEHDPLLRQVLPLQEEQTSPAHFNLDPVGDLPSRATGGLLHKYQNRVLIIATGACAVHCRYCFRRHFPYGENALSPEQWQAILGYLHTHTDVEEVIFSGGDPLSLPDRRLSEWVQSLETVPHLKRLRIHTRVPVVLPSRVDNALIDWLSTTRLKKVIVLHINHAQEINEDLRAAIKKLANTQSTLLNQTVLLKGINDSAATQITLAKTLFDAGVLPYYIHVLDKVVGAAHFDTAPDQAQTLLKAMHAALPGYLVPRFVAEHAGDPGKRWVNLDL